MKSIKYKDQSISDYKPNKNHNNRIKPDGKQQYYNK